MVSAVKPNPNGIMISLSLFMLTTSLLFNKSDMLYNLDSMPNQLDFQKPGNIMVLAAFPIYIIPNTSKAIKILIIQMTKKAIVMSSFSIFISPDSKR